MQIKLAEKQWKNRHSDRVQYIKYKEVLGTELGADSLDEFQSLKYNNLEEWKRKQDNYYVKSRLKDGRWGTTINPEKQAPHIESTRVKGRSYLFDNIDPQKLFDKYAGTDIVERDRKGHRTNKEKVIADSIIGIAVSKNGAFQTNAFKIHHSKDRTHIVPVRSE